MMSVGRLAAFCLAALAAAGEAAVEADCVAPFAGEENNVALQVYDAATKLGDNGKHAPKKQEEQSADRPSLIPVKVLATAVKRIAKLRAMKALFGHLGHISEALKSGNHLKHSRRPNGTGRIIANNSKWQAFADHVADLKNMVRALKFGVHVKVNTSNGQARTQYATVAKALARLTKSLAGTKGRGGNSGGTLGGITAAVAADKQQQAAGMAATSLKEKLVKARAHAAWKKAMKRIRVVLARVVRERHTAKMQLKKLKMKAADQVAKAKTSKLSNNTKSFVTEAVEAERKKVKAKQVKEKKDYKAKMKTISKQHAKNLEHIKKDGKRLKEKVDKLALKAASKAVNIPLPVAKPPPAAAATR